MAQLLRIILKRTVQPPIDTPASIEFKTVDVEVPPVLHDWMTGKDVSGCAVSAVAIGSENIKE